MSIETWSQWEWMKYTQVFVVLWNLLCTDGVCADFCAVSCCWTVSCVCLLLIRRRVCSWCDSADWPLTSHYMVSNQSAASVTAVYLYTEQREPKVKHCNRPTHCAAEEGPNQHTHTHTDPHTQHKTIQAVLNTRHQKNELNTFIINNSTTMWSCKCKKRTIKTV